MIILLILLSGYVYAQEPALIPANFDAPFDINIDSDDLSEIAIDLCFDQEEREVLNRVYPKVIAKLKLVNQVPIHIKTGISNDLRRLKEDAHKHRHSRHTYGTHYPHLNFYITDTVNKSLKETLEEMKDEIKDLSSDSQCYKWTAVAVGALGTLATVTSALVVHFVQGNGQTGK